MAEVFAVYKTSKSSTISRSILNRKRKDISLPIQFLPGINQTVLGKVHLIWQGGMKILRGGGAPKFFRHPKGGALKKLGGLQRFVYFKTNRIRGTLKNLNR